MKGIMKTLFLSCKKATELIAKREIQALSVKERLQLKSHLRMCDACNVYEKYSRSIDILLKSKFDQHSKEKFVVIQNPQLKKRISDKL
jgi:hypothetical protein